MNRLLRYSRIIISLLIFAATTFALTCGALAIPGLGDWIASMQIGIAIATLSLTALTVWFIITLIFGRIYCSTVCPIGTLADISARIPRLSRRRRKALRYRYEPARNITRMTVFLLFIAAIAFTLTAVLSVIEPYRAYIRVCHDFFRPLVSLGLPASSTGIPAATTVTSAIVATFIFVATVIVSSRHGRIICNTVCPIGSILGFVSRHSIFHIDIDTDKCIRCHRCEHVCKSSCIDLTDHVVDTTRCVDCFDCINVCQNGAIHYTTHRKQLSDPLMQRIGGITRGSGTPASTPSSSASKPTTTDKSTKK